MFSTPSTFYLCSTPGRLQIIHKRHGQYCKELMVKHKKTYPPLEPQPSANDILSVHRNYNKLKANPHYKRRITWINIGSDTQHTTAVAEYLGTYPGQYPHGNSKYNTQGYSRTSGSVLEAIGEQCNSAKPNHVFIHMNNNSSELHRPSNLKQVQNKKYNDTRKQRKNTMPSTVTGNTLADNFQHINNILHTHPFVQHTFESKHHVPAVILYIPEQIQDIRRFCCSRPVGLTTVLGVDKTYNLGPLHVTPMVFKYLGLRSKNRAGK